MKIYTKTGDKGDTSLLGGSRVQKNHPRIEAYGTIDELNSYLGFAISSNSNEAINKKLFEIQNHLFIIGSHLAKESDKDFPLPQIKETAILDLEKEIDKMESSLEPLKTFILPGGHPVSSLIHIARCICRRAERCCVNLNQQQDFPMIIKYLNRLSDFLFVLSRYINYLNQQKEIFWISTNCE